jgi:hypothetical protein
MVALLHERRPATFTMESLTETVGSALTRVPTRRSPTELKEPPLYLNGGLDGLLWLIVTDIAVQSFVNTLCLEDVASDLDIDHLPLIAKFFGGGVSCTCRERFRFPIFEWRGLLFGSPDGRELVRRSPSATWLQQATNSIQGIS